MSYRERLNHLMDDLITAGRNVDSQYRYLTILRYRERSSPFDPAVKEFQQYLLAVKERDHCLALWEQLYAEYQQYLIHNPTTTG